MLPSRLFYLYGDKGIWLPVANVLFTPSSPPTSPAGAIHGTFSSCSFGGDFVSNPLMEIRGFEPLTSSLQSWRSSQLSYIPE